MRRLIIGATAIVTALAAALGVVVRRRRARRDDVLPLDPAPPLRGSTPALHEPVAAPSIEADFGPVGDPPADAAASPATVTRKPRAPRKASTSKRGTTGKARTGKARTAASSTNDAAGQTAGPAVRPKRPTRVRTTPAATSAESVAPATSDGADPADGS